VEVRRFGPGNRRSEGPPGTQGITGQVIHSDGRGLISELAFGRDGRIEPHTNPNTTWFIVIEGGGWVVVDGERLRVAAGEAVLWPSNVPHAAWAERSHMRAFVVEFSGSDDSAMRTILEGHVAALDAGERPVTRAEGRLTAPEHDAVGEPGAGEPR
jgi:quercetin dioxygenase-like cupin family protein